MYIAIIIFIVILLLAIVVVINFSDSNVPKLARWIVSSIIIIILAGGVYYLTKPISPVTSISPEAVSAELQDTTQESVTIMRKDTVATEIPKEDIPKDTIISLAAEPSEAERRETVPKTITSTDTVKEATPKNTVVRVTVNPTETIRTEAGTSIASTLKPIPADSLSTSIAAPETLTPKKQIINACTAWIIMSNKPAKVTYRNCCTNTDITITVTGSLGICAVYGFTPTGSGVTLLSNGSCKCK